MKIGITGSGGNLGSYLKNQFREYKLYYFNGRIEKKSDINKWIKGKNFDVIIIHYSICIIFRNYISFLLRKKIRNFKGLKIILV